MINGDECRRNSRGLFYYCLRICLEGWWYLWRPELPGCLLHYVSYPSTVQNRLHLHKSNRNAGVCKSGVSIL